MFHFIFRDEGDAGGVTGNAGADLESKSPATDAPGDKGADRGSGENKGGEQDKGKPPEEPTIESLTSERDYLKSKLGKQGNELSDRTKESDVLKTLYKDLNENPELALAKMAKKFGTKLLFGDKAVDPIDAALSSPDDEDRLKLLNARQKNNDANDIKNDMMSEFKTMVDPLFEDKMISKYPDYDDLKEDREHIGLMSDLGKLTKSELHHWAAQGRNMPAAIKQAGVEAVEVYRKSLDKKSGEQIDTPGGRLAGKQKVDFGIVSIGLNDLM